MLKNITYPIFKIQNSVSVTGSDLKNLRKFYAPILGSNAVLLYEYLRDLSYSESDDSGYYDYDSLTYLLNMDIKTLNDARIKLESVSLISTFIDEFNRKTYFVLERPLDSSSFKKNLILANKLIKIIGLQSFERLMGRERNLFLSKAKDLLDASAKYDEVFDQDNDLGFELASHEIDPSDISTTEINDEIEEKISLNTFEYPNPYEAILKTDSRYFYSQISGKLPTESIIEVIKDAREAQMSDPCINIILFYAYEMNNRINTLYVKKILCDLIKNNIFSFEAIEKYLDNLVKLKNKVLVTKKDLYKATYLENLKKEDNLSKMEI